MNVAKAEGLVRAAAALCLVVTTISEAAPVFIPLGDLSGGVFRSDAFGISSSGSTAAGSSADDQGGGAVIWTQADGLVKIAEDGFSTALSADGSTVVGGLFNPNVGATEPFVWSVGSGLQPLGFPTGVVPSGVTVAEDVSADGGTVVGSTVFAANGLRAFQWTESSGLAQLTGGVLDAAQESTATGVSAGADVVVGTALGAAREAYRWTAAGGAIGLGDLPGGQVESSATGVSPDGTTVFGTSASSSSAVAAFRWTEQSGLVDLGSLSGQLSQTTPLSATGAGEAIVGREDSFGPTGGVDAFVWTEAFGIESLQSVLEDRHGLASPLTGWTLSVATDISPDGRSLVGFGINPMGNQEGWIVRLDTPIFVPEPMTYALLSIAFLAAPTHRAAR